MITVAKREMSITKMSEKLYKSHCSVSGHGTQCSVADDIYPSKKQLSKIRRRVAKKFIAYELSMLDEEMESDKTDC